jgi:hypothetical protein
VSVTLTEPAGRLDGYLSGLKAVNKQSQEDASSLAQQWRQWQQDKQQKLDVTEVSSAAVPPTAEPAAAALAAGPSAATGAPASGTSLTQAQPSTVVAGAAAASGAAGAAVARGARGAPDAVNPEPPQQRHRPSYEPGDDEYTAAERESVSALLAADQLSGRSPREVKRLINHLRLAKCMWNAAYRTPPSSEQQRQLVGWVFLSCFHARGMQAVLSAQVSWGDSHRAVLCLHAYVGEKSMPSCVLLFD